MVREENHLLTNTICKKQLHTLTSSEPLILLHTTFLDMMHDTFLDLHMHLLHDTFLDLDLVRNASTNVAHD